MSDNKFVRRELQRCVRGVTIHGMLDWGIEWLLFYTNNTPSVCIGMQLTEASNGCSYTNNTPSVCIGMQLTEASNGCSFTQTTHHLYALTCNWTVSVNEFCASSLLTGASRTRVTYTMWRVWHTSHAVCRIACDANGTRHTPCDVYHETHVYFYYFYSECYTNSKSQIVKLDVFHPEYEYIPIHLTLFPVVEDHLSADNESCCIKSVWNIQADNIFNVSSRPRVGGQVLHIL